jgi:hypothetical protein
MKQILNLSRSRPGGLLITAGQNVLNVVLRARPYASGRIINEEHNRFNILRNYIISFRRNVMKKLILPLLLLLAISMLVAVESDPSAVVGYFKVTAPATGESFVSIPFHIETGMPSETFGNQFTAGDAVLDPYSGLSSDYYGPGLDEGWYPDDAGFVAPGHFYYTQNNSGTDTDYYLLGTVNPAGFTLDMLGQNLGGWTPFALNDAAPIFVETLGFPTLIYDEINGFADQIVDITSGISADYYGPVDGWYASDGQPFNIMPTHCYLFQSWTGTGFSWTYTPPAPPARNGFNSLNTKSTRSSK